MPRVLLNDNSIQEITRESAIDLIKQGAARGIVTDKGVEIPPEAEAEKIGEGKSKETKEPKKPLWSRKIPVSQQRNLNVVVWPPGGNRKNPSIALEEGRKQEDSWNTRRIYLPLAKSWEIADRIRQAACFVRDREE